MDVSEKIVRNSIRLIDYNYSQPRAYFVTICTDNRACYFGNIVDGIMISFSICEIIGKTWQVIPEKFHNVELDSFIIMPNHFHGIVIINKDGKGLIHQSQRNDCRNSRRDFTQQTPVDDRDSRRGLIYQTPTTNQAPTIDQGQINVPSDFSVPHDEKSWILMENSKRTIDKIIRYFKTKSAKSVHDRRLLNFKWQRNYYEHVVRSRGELGAIREYIINNPYKWSLDRENRLSKNFNMNFDKYFKDIF